MRHNFHHNNLVGVCFEPQVLNDSAATGAAIVEPQHRGTDITFILCAGDMAATATGSGALQGRLRSDGSTWEALTEYDGVTALVFLASLFTADSVLEDDVVIGTIPLDRIDWDTYEAIRIVVTNAVAVAVTIGCCYVISGVRSVPSGQTDYLFAKCMPS